MIQCGLGRAFRSVQEVLSVSCTVAAGRYVLALANLHHSRRNRGLGLLQSKGVLDNRSGQPRGYMPESMIRKEDSLRFNLNCTIPCDTAVVSRDRRNGTARLT